MFRPWYDKYGNLLKIHHSRFEKINRNASASTPNLSIGILEEFVLISIITLFCVETHFYALWVGVLIGFFIHLLGHIGSFIIKRGYVPSIITSVIGSVYTIVVLLMLNDLVKLDVSEVVMWSLFSLVILIINLQFITILIEKFDKFLVDWVITDQNQQ